MPRRVALDPPRQAPPRIQSHGAAGCGPVTATGPQHAERGAAAVRHEPNKPKEQGAATPTPPPFDSQTVYRERAEAAHVDHAAHITRIRQQLAAEQLQREAGMAL